MKGSIPAGSLSALEARMVMRSIREDPAFDKVLVAMEDIFADSSAFLLELSTAQALPRLAHLCDEAVCVSPRRATVRTLVNSGSLCDEA